MHRNRDLFVIRKKTVCLKMQICIERIGEKATLVHFHSILPDICTSGEPENILTANYR